MAGSGISTLDKEPSTWTEPPSDWGSNADDSWSDALPSPSAPAALGQDPAPVSDSGWGGGSAWGGSSSGGESWGGGSEPAATRPPSLAPSAPTSSAGGWLGGKAEDDWAESSAPSGLGLGAAPARTAPLSDSSESWGGSPGLSGSKAPSSEADGWGGGGLASASPARGPSLSQAEDGWGGGASAGPLGGARSVPAPAQGWLGGDEPQVEEGGSSVGWLGDSRTAAVGPSRTSEGNGWLGGDDGPAARGPSMTEMVDRAIGEEEADDFVDDSWVDEEVDQGEFDDLGVPEYVAPTPEVGGAFVKMLLVAVLVLLVGGGVMFLGQEKKTPEQIKAEETAKELAFARGSVEKGKEYLAKGQPLLAVGPLEAAIPALKTSGGSEDEVLSTKSTLATALMKTKEYQKAYEHWASLAKSAPAYKAEARKQMVECSKLLRAQATAKLAEAAPYIKAGESSSVLQLGQESLKIFEQHSGTASQKGKALGVIGRGYFNGKEYGKAKETFKKALALNPAGGYQADLARIAAATAPVDYYAGGGGYYSAPEPVAAPSQPVRVEARIDDGPGYATAASSGGGGGSRRVSSTTSTESAAPAPAAPQRMQAIKAYNRNTSGGGSKGRLGQKGVLNGY